MARRSIRRSRHPSQRPQELSWAAKQEAGANYLAEVRSRSCLVCGSPRAYFGFGPPLVPKLVWACLAHRANIDPVSSELPPCLR
jgi:hypothetical protein